MTFRKSAYFLFAGVSALFVWRYVQYAFHGWFYQDDFGLMWQYSHGLAFSDIIYRTHDFGRFITRNVYWYLLYAGFGKHAVYYFLFNLDVILFNTGLLFLLIDKLTRDRFLAVVSAAVYLTSFSMMKNYTWLSNSQHIIAHVFIFLFFMCAMHSRYRLWSTPVFLLGIYSNELALFALPPLFAYWFFNKNYSAGIAVLLGIIAIVFLVLSMQMAGGAYQIQWTWESLSRNGHFYFGGVICWVIVPFWAFISYRAFKDRDAVLAFLITAAISFYLPFAFLEYQRATNYFALSYLFNLTVLFYVLRKWPWIMVIIFLAFSIRTFCKISESISHPAGGEAKQLVERVRQLNLPASEKTICFKSTQSAFWWVSGHGAAFKLFVSPENHYVLYSPSAKCDRIILL